MVRFIQTVIDQVVDSRSFFMIHFWYDLTIGLLHSLFHRIPLHPGYIASCIMHAIWDRKFLQILYVLTWILCMCSQNVSVHLPVDDVNATGERQLPLIKIILLMVHVETSYGWNTWWQPLSIPRQGYTCYPDTGHWSRAMYAWLGLARSRSVVLSFLPLALWRGD